MFLENNEDCSFCYSNAEEGLPPQSGPQIPDDEVVVQPPPVDQVSRSSGVERESCEVCSSVDEICECFTGRPAGTVGVGETYNPGPLERVKTLLAKKLSDLRNGLTAAEGSEGRARRNTGSFNEVRGRFMSMRN